MTKYIKDALIIVIAAIAIGLTYNAINPKGIPFIYNEKTVDAVPDSLLMGKNNGNPADLSNLDQSITADQMKYIVNNDEFLIIDARSPDLYTQNKIGDAINIHPYEDEMIYMEKIMTVPRGKKIVVYCDGGSCDLSHKVAEDLKNASYQNVFVFSGGWEEWTSKYGQ